jgi:hypothetical protein
MGSTFNSLVGLIILALDIWAILNVIKSGSEVGIKVLWILLIALLPVVGLVIWGSRRGTDIASNGAVTKFSHWFKENPHPHNAALA